MATILAIGGIQCLFFSFLLFNKKGKALPDQILAGLLIILFFQLASNYLEFTGRYDRFPHLVGSTSSLVFLYGPLLYFYVKCYISGASRFRWKDLFHFLPFAIYNLILLPFYAKSAPEKLAYHQEVLSAAPGFWLSIALICKAISLPIYLIWALYLIKDHQKNINQHFADTEHIDLKWLKYLIWSMVVVGLVVLLSALIRIASSINIETERYIFAAATLWILGLGYYGLKQTPIFVGNSDANEPPISPPKIRSYEKNRIKASDAETYEQMLLKHMEKGKPYLNNKLTLTQLAKEIEIPGHHLSQILNERLKQNFFDFINGYRIEEFKAQLKKPGNKNLTLLGIAMNCGFNSKASFNRIFKKHTGLTPSQYLESSKQALN